MGLIKKTLLTILLDKSDEILEREAKNFGGNACHVILPAKHRGKRVMIICSEDIEEVKNDKKK